MDRQATVRRYREARSDRSAAVLEGFHPLKHALRFGADVRQALSPDPSGVLALARELAPDVERRLEGLLTPVPEELYAGLSPRPPDSEVVALARRPAADPPAVLEDPSPAPVVLLERPTHLGNLGAAVRAAAAAGAAGVLATGEHDPWHPSALRGSAGLHFALPVAAVGDLAAVEGPPGGAGPRASRSPTDGRHGRRQPEDRRGGGTAPDPAAGGNPEDHGRRGAIRMGAAGGRPLVAVDPGGRPLAPSSLPRRALLAFGSERRGLRPATLERADLRLRIPMREGVSSLNLATAVAVVLYAWRLDAAADRGCDAG